jgi:hypothetical protein
MESWHAQAGIPKRSESGRLERRSHLTAGDAETSVPGDTMPQTEGWIVSSPDGAFLHLHSTVPVDDEENPS